MKRTISHLLLTLLCLIAAATPVAGETLEDSLGFPFSDHENQSETETLFGSEDFSVTGFGGPFMSTSEINGTKAYFLGGRGAVLFNRTFLLGGGGCGLVYPTDRSDITGIPYSGEDKYLHMGYGGGLIGINLFQQNIINLSITSLIGAGGLYFSDITHDEDHQKCEQQCDKCGDDFNGESFFVMEPTVMLHLNVSRWMRVGAGVSYRYTNGISTQDLTDEDFNTWSTVFAVDFGWF
ncbi:MAG: hypothetical protein ACOC2H_10420 [Spirochaetota bacterium]